MMRGTDGGWLVGISVERLLRMLSRAKH
jgi:hypothetical protein